MKLKTVYEDRARRIRRRAEKKVSNHKFIGFVLCMETKRYQRLSKRYLFYRERRDVYRERRKTTIFFLLHSEHKN